LTSQSRTSIEFIMRSPTTDPEDIAEELGLTPTSAWRVGDRVTPGATLLHKTNGVRLVRSSDEASVPETLLQRLLEDLRASRASIAASACMKDINIVVEADWATPSITIDPELLREIADLGATLGICVYYVGGTEEVDRE
jgi:hypothetical protein